MPQKKGKISRVKLLIRTCVCVCVYILYCCDNLWFYALYQCLHRFQQYVEPWLCSFFKGYLLKLQHWYDSEQWKATLMQLNCLTSIAPVNFMSYYFLLYQWMLVLLIEFNVLIWKGILRKAEVRNVFNSEEQQM